MIALRHISAGGAVLMSAAVASVYTVAVVSNPSASAEDVAFHEIGDSSSAVPVAPTQKVRVIGVSAEDAVTSDQTRWYNHARRPPVQKNATPPVEVRTADKTKKKAVRRAAPPPQDAYSAYASEPRQRREGFRLFDW
jgi:hypothetical protein